MLLFYHFDAESKQLYRTKADSLSHYVCPMGEYAMLWRDAGDTLEVFCLLLKTGQLVQAAPDNFSPHTLNDETKASHLSWKIGVRADPISR